MGVPPLEEETSEPRAEEEEVEGGEAPPALPPPVVGVPVPPGLPPLGPPPLGPPPLGPPPLGPPPLPPPPIAPPPSEAKAPAVAPADEAAPILDALDDSDTRELVVIAGRRPRVRGAAGWTELDDEVSMPLWTRVWNEVAQRTGAPSDPAGGHVTHQAPGGLVVEAMLPPLSQDPVLHVRRRPPEMSLDAWIEDGRLDGDADAVRDALTNRQGVLVIGDRGAGRTSVLEALAAATPAGERVAAVEMLPQLRVPGALRLRLDPSNPSPALSAARSAMSEWLVLDDATPQAVGAAAVEAEANRAALLATARGADADAWMGQVARSIAYEVSDADAFVRAAFPVVVRVETGPDGRPRARVEKS